MEKIIQKEGLIQRKMMQLDPKLMAQVMAWNSMALEYNISEDEELQKQYIALYEKARLLVEE